MSENIFDQPFVYCGVCHRRSTKEDPLYLTSCAHTLCSQHISDSTCPTCQTRGILIIKLVESKQLPEEIKILFQPISGVLENLYNVSQFQMTGLVGQCRYYQDHCIKLQEKCARQRQLLYQAKQELDTVANLRSRIAELEGLMREKGDLTPCLNTPKSSFFTVKKVPDTVDLTDDGSPLRRNEQFFIAKLKTTSSLRNRLRQQKQYFKGHSQSTLTMKGTSYDDNGVIKESAHLSVSASTPNSYHENRSFSCSSSMIDAIPDKHTLPLVVNDAISTASKRLDPMKKTQLQFPGALERLRNVRRDYTFNNATETVSRAHQGLTSHVRSNNTLQTQTGLLMRRNSTCQTTPRAGSMVTKGANNKFKRVR